MSTFEFSGTCEMIRHDAVVQQPYAVGVNVITLCLIMGLLVKKWGQIDWTARCVALAVILLEVWHALCHARPFLLSKSEYRESSMVDITHSFYLILMIALTCFVYKHARVFSRNMWFWVGLGFLMIVDICVWTMVRKVWMIFSGLAIGLYLLVVFMMANHRTIPRGIAGIIMTFFVLAFVMLYYEKQWCEISTFPLHVITESIFCVIVVSAMYILFSTIMRIS